MVYPQDYEDDGCVSPRIFGLVDGKDWMAENVRKNSAIGRGYHPTK